MGVCRGVSGAKRQTYLSNENLRTISLTSQKMLDSRLAVIIICLYIICVVPTRLKNTFDAHLDILCTRDSWSRFKPIITRCGCLWVTLNVHVPDVCLSFFTLASSVFLWAIEFQTYANDQHILH